MIYFVTETWLKTNTPVTANIDAVKIFPFVQSQSDMRMQPILGTYFYKHLLTAYNAQTLTNDEETLVFNYLKFIHNEFTLSLCNL